MLLNRPVNLPQNEILTAGESGDYTDMHRHGAALAELEQSPEQQLLAVQAVRKIPEQAAAVGMVLPALAAESVFLPTVLHLELLPEQMLLILSLHLFPLLCLLQVLAVGDTAVKASCKSCQRRKPLHSSENASNGFA